MLCSLFLGQAGTYRGQLATELPAIMWCDINVLMPDVLPNDKSAAPIALLNSDAGGPNTSGRHDCNFAYTNVMYCNQADCSQLCHTDFRVRCDVPRCRLTRLQ